MPDWLAAGWLVGWLVGWFDSTTILAGIVDPFQQYWVSISIEQSNETGDGLKSHCSRQRRRKVFFRGTRGDSGRVYCAWMILERVSTFRGANSRAKA